MLLARRCLLFLLSSLLLSGPRESPAQQPGRPDRRYALLIAVRQYSKTELRSLEYTESDVEKLAGVLKRSGCPAENIRILSQRAIAEDADLAPTARNVREQLRLMLADRSEEDSVFVAFAGHGVQFKGADEHFFCPMDARLADRTTLVSLADVYEELRACKAGFKLLLVDACRNDPQAEGARARTEVDLESVTRPQTQKPPGGVMAFFSCSAGEKSYEHKDLEQGVFFHYVVRGLQGDADANKDGLVTLTELAESVQRRVPDFVKSAYSTRQTPTLVGEVQGIVPLVLWGKGATDVERGRKLLRDFQYVEAIAAFTEALKQEPKNAEVYALRAEARADHCDYVEALDDWTEATRLDPASFRFAEGRAGALLRLGMRTDAVRAYREIVGRIEPDDAESYWIRGAAYAGLAECREDSDRRAVADLSEALRRDPKHQRSLRTRGGVAREAKRYEESLADFDAALRIDPTDWEALYGRAETYRERGSATRTESDFDRAYAELSDAIRLNPRCPSLYCRRGYVSLQKKDYSRALRDYDEALRHNPRTADAFNGQGMVFSNQKQPQRAVEEYSRAISLMGSISDFLANRASALYVQEKHDQALEDVERAIQLKPESAYAHNWHGNILTALEKPREAIAAFDLAIEQDERDPWYFINRGYAHRLCFSWDEAVADYARAIELDPKHAYGHNGLGIVYYRRDMNDKAFDEFSAAIRIEPQAIFYNNRADVHDDRKEYRKAVADRTEALRLEPKNTYALRQRGWAYYRLKEYDPALADYNEAIRLDPNDHGAYNGRGNVYDGKKQNVPALADYNRAISLAKTRHASYYYNRGSSYRKTRNYDWALADLNEAIRLYPTDADYLEERALIYEAKGDSARARADRAAAERNKK